MSKPKPPKPGRSRPLSPLSLSLLQQGGSLHQRGQFRQAEEFYTRALREDIANHFAWQLLGALKIQMRQPEEALAALSRAVALDPGYVDAHYNLGVALDALRRLEEAITAYDRVIALQPGHLDAHLNKGIAHGHLKQFTEALACSDRVLARAPTHVGATLIRAIALRDLKRLDEAEAAYARVLQLAPRHEAAFGGVVSCSLKRCDFARRPALIDAFHGHLAAEDASISPFLALGYFDDPMLLRRSAEVFCKRQIPRRPPSSTERSRTRPDKIRIGYLSANFNRHAVAWLMADLIEAHDRSAFEIIGLSIGRDDGSEIRQRLAGSFDRFIDAAALPDAAVAQTIRDLQVDILVDLMGHTEDARPQILAERPAPIQVNYLGYPGTIGADFLDYLIADPIVAPAEHQSAYSEQLVHLPDCYQPNDRKRMVAGTMPTRAEAGLPETGFVFCSFNNNWKISPEVFAVWMRLLRRVDGSVLWLLSDNPAAEQNLRESAAASGIAPERLIFAPRADNPVHLARHGLADLFLDTLPYNAHTTASDALWMGLPVLTCQGNAFAARVASSLLTAIGLPELVTTDLAGYEKLALVLATDPDRLAEIRRKLADNRTSQPLFDTPRLCRHLELAYTTMMDIWLQGEAPRGFAVPRT